MNRQISLCESRPTIFVTTGLDPVVHADLSAAWIAGSSPAMTRIKVTN
jgi:hypothetical protein